MELGTPLDVNRLCRNPLKFKLNVQWITTPKGGCKEFNSILSFIIKDQNALMLKKKLKNQGMKWNSIIELEYFYNFYFYLYTMTAALVF